jgi:hypothetical protein
MNLFEKHPKPWRVDFQPMCKEWDRQSCPVVVDASGKTVITPKQYVYHPGVLDEIANEVCKLIVNLANESEA